MRYPNRQLRLIAPLILLLSAVGNVLVAQEQAASPAVGEPLTHYQGREIAQTMHYFGAPWLVRDSRQREEDCETMVSQLGVKPGMTVVDFAGYSGLKPNCDVALAVDLPRFRDLLNTRLSALDARLKEA